MTGRDEFTAAPALLVAFLCNHCPYVQHVETALGMLLSHYPDLAVGHLHQRRRCLPPRPAGLLKAHGDLDGAGQILRGLAGAGDRYAARELAGLLAARGDLEGAGQVPPRRGGSARRT